MGVLVLVYRYKGVPLKSKKLRKTLRDLYPQPVFTRTGVAYDERGVSVPENIPRYKIGDGGVLVEEATTNLLTAGVSLVMTEAYTTGTINGAHTFSCKTGSYELSGGATGTVTPSTPQTKTIVSATVTLTPTGDPTFNQVEAKAYPTSWTLGGTTRNASTLTIPSNVLNIDTNGYSNLLPASQSNTLTSGSPYETATLVAGVAYTFSCTTGSYELSGGRGTVTPSNPITVTPGAVKITLTGDSTGNQLSATSVAKPWILGGTTQSVRETTIEGEFYWNGANPGATRIYLYPQSDGNNREYLQLSTSGSLTYTSIQSGKVSITGSLTLSAVATAGWVKFAVKMDKNSIDLIVNGNLEGKVTVANPVLTSIMTTFNVGSTTTLLHGDTYIRNLVISKRKRSDSEIQQRASSGFVVDKDVTYASLFQNNLNAKRVAKVA